MQEIEEMKKFCIVCGAPVKGRPDKKFCSPECKNAYHNDIISQKKNYRNRVLTSLNTNYRILDHLLAGRVDSIALCDIESLGFKPKLVTGYNITKSRMAEFRCFDIGYYQTSSRIYKITRVKNR